MGKRLGWLGPSGIVFGEFMRELVLNDFDWILIECTVMFPQQDAMEPLLATYSLDTLQICPTQLGFPIRRPRKYMMLLKKAVLTWRPEIASKGITAFFKELFARKVEMVGDELARAPQEEVNADKERLAFRRGLPRARSSGRAWNSLHLLTPAQRRHIKVYKKPFKSGVRMVCNPLQSPTRFRATVFVPTLLKASSIWSMNKRRLFTALEHIECQGYQVFGPEADNPEKLEAGRALSDAEIRSLAGNGMHSACVGACMMFLFACSQRVSAS